MNTEVLEVLEAEVAELKAKVEQLTAALRVAALESKSLSRELEITEKDLDDLRAENDALNTRRDTV